MNHLAEVKVKSIRGNAWCEAREIAGGGCTLSEFLLNATCNQRPSCKQREI